MCDHMQARASLSEWLKYAGNEELQMSRPWVHYMGTSTRSSLVRWYKDNDWHKKIVLHSNVQL